MDKKTVLEEASGVVDGSRQEEYGSPVPCWKAIAKMWSVILGHEVTAAQAILCMAGMKIMREVHNHKQDNLVDLCGYARIAEMIADEEAKD